MLNESWLNRQPLRTRVAIWCLMAATWPSAVVAAIAALAGWNGWWVWLLTALAAAILYSFPVFWPERAARSGARQLMSQAEEQRLRDLPPPHPGRNL